MNDQVLTPAGGIGTAHERSWRGEREAVYQTLALTAAQQRSIEELVRLSPARAVGKGALRNIRGSLPSKKCEALRLFESHTVERMFLYELELDPQVVGYVTQVPLTRVERRLPNGRRHIAAATLDVLVFSRNAITLVECKDLSWLRAHEDRKGWSCNDGTWSCEPYARWAVAHGLAFRVWHPPFPFAIYLRNLELLFTRLGEPLDKAAEPAAAKIPRLLRNHTFTWADLRAQLPGIDGRSLTILLAQRQLFGTIQSDPIGADAFRIFGDEAQALEVDQALLHARARMLGTPGEEVPAATPSTAVAHCAMRRLQRLQAIEKGEARPTRRMRKLAKQVAEAVQKGVTPYDACLPSYAVSGNRLARLDETQQSLLRRAVKDFQGRTPPIAITSAWTLLETECSAAEADAPSITTFRRALRAEDPALRALKTGGMRAYQATAARSDPRLRSGAASGFLHTVHIDSSKRDVRASSELKRLIDQRRALKDDAGRGYDSFYIAVDESSDSVVGHAFVVGPSRIEGVALLMREIVHRHGALPRAIVDDRGPDNQSRWLKQFALSRGITLLDTMSGGSRSNSQAENRIGQVNARVSQRLPGSTLPDKAGRSVDGKFKSLMTAKLEFLQLCGLIEAFLYEDVPHIPNAQGETPQQRKEAAVERLGTLGIPCLFDDELLFATSPRWTGGFVANERRGIRLGNHDFTSLEVRNALRTGTPQELRLDAADPSVLHVIINGQRLRAFHGKVQQRAALSAAERLWLRLVEPAIQAANRDQKTQVERKLSQRMERARAAADAHTHLHPSATVDASEVSSMEDPATARWTELWDDAAAEIR
ncbi:hypothetical protein [Metallibacterium scheffleri]|uniref:hypothetical protein n=1 Tax=Metallibacterium scheffleri TaxID=993689 RepID=UPI00109F6944|nr:hypothetical protein [Metallibacterium scheffleri]